MKPFNILIIDDEWPTKFSGKALRILNIVKHLSGKHNFHYLCINARPISDPGLLDGLFRSVSNIKPFYKCTWYGRLLNVLLFQPGAYARWKYPDDWQRISAAIKQIVIEKKIDLIQSFSYFGAQYISEVKERPRIWDVGDSYSLCVKRSLKFKSFKNRVQRAFYALRLYNFESRLIKKFEKIIFVSNADANIHALDHEKIQVIVNGVDVNYYAAEFGAEEPRTLIFTGHMSFEPNVNAVIYFVKNILPPVREFFPDTKFYVIGAEPTDEILALGEDPNTIISGEVEDIRPFMKKATIFVAPLVSGGGVKNKILQAMAMGKAIVSTPLGIEALDLEQGKEILVAKTPEMFVKCIVRLFKDDDLRKTISVNALQRVRVNYDWRLITKKYSDVYDALVKF